MVTVAFHNKFDALLHGRGPAQRKLNTEPQNVKQMVTVPFGSGFDAQLHRGGPAQKWLNTEPQGIDKHGRGSNR